MLSVVVLLTRTGTRTRSCKPKLPVLRSQLAIILVQLVASLNLQFITVRVLGLLVRVFTCTCVLSTARRVMNTIGASAPKKYNMRQQQNAPDVYIRASIVNMSRIGA